MDSRACECCLEEIAQISLLEKEINKSSVLFYQTVHGTGRNSKSTALSLGNIFSPSCLADVQEEWIKTKKLHSCADFHLDNTAKYHNFCHEVRQLKKDMQEMITHAEGAIPLNLAYIGDRQYINTIEECLNELVFSYRYWVCKLHKIAENSKNVTDPSERLIKIKNPTPITALCDYKTNNYDVKANEDLMLIDNSDPLMWRVCNLEKSHEFSLPSVVCHIPPPNFRMISLCQELLVEYLKAWTINIKRLGKNLILYMVYIVWNFTEEEMENMKYLSKEDKQKIMTILDHIMKELKPVWGGSKGYLLLSEQVESFKTSLQSNYSSNTNYSSKGCIDSRLTKLGDIMTKFNSLWSYWSSFHSVVNFSLESHNLLCVSKLKELEVIKREDLRTMWQNELEFECDDETHTENWMTVLKQTFTKVKCNHEQKQKTLEAEERMRSEQEEKKVFTITGVFNPLSGQDISMQHAVELGIIDQSNGMYVDAVKSISIPIPEAMNQGLIKVEVTVVKKTKEKKADMGLITIQTKLESKPYEVVAVVDSQTGHHLSVDQALEKGIIDLERELYVNSRTHSYMSLKAALDAKLIEVEFDEDSEFKEPELVSQVYAVYKVKDQLKREEVGFSVAIRRGILDQNTGSYYNNLTGEHIFISKAIQNGYIHANIVDKDADI